MHLLIGLPGTAVAFNCFPGLEERAAGTGRKAGGWRFPSQPCSELRGPQAPRRSLPSFSAAPLPSCLDGWTRHYLYLDSSIMEGKNFTLKPSILLLILLLEWKLLSKVTLEKKLKTL